MSDGGGERGGWTVWFDLCRSSLPSNLPSLSHFSGANVDFSEVPRRKEKCEVEAEGEGEARFRFAHPLHGARGRSKSTERQRSIHGG